MNNKAPGYALCNELFGSLSFEQSCELTADLGFQGIEIAPFTVFDDTFRVGRKKRAALRKALADNGLRFAGLHWLLSAPEGLHITSPDSAIRERTKEHMKMLLDLAGELGGGNLILGSPPQRTTPTDDPAEIARAAALLQDELEGLAGFAEEHNSTILLEALPRAHTTVVNTLTEAARMIEAIDRPGIGGMFDFHNCVDETKPWAELIRFFAPMIAHVHLNTWDGGAPTPADVPAFREAFSALDEIEYRGWISLEMFTVPENVEQVLTVLREFLEQVWDAS